MSKDASIFAGTAGLEVTLDFTLEPQDVVAVRGKPLVLQCAVSSSVPGPVNITWTHEGEPIPLVSDSRRHLLSNGSLYFKKVSLELLSNKYVTVQICLFKLNKTVSHTVLIS
jgi:hypothetical protein